MKKIGVSLAFLLSPFFADGVAAGDAEHVEVTDAYVRGLPPGVANTSAYMTIHNRGSEDMVLIGGQADFVDSVTIHSSENNNGMMTMVHRMSVVVPVGGQLVLETGGLHLMLMGLNRPLGNEEVALILDFRSGVTHTLHLPVINVLDE